VPRGGPPKATEVSVQMEVVEEDSVTAKPDVAVHKIWVVAVPCTVNPALATVDAPTKHFMV
jgi:hypothetical protein